MYGLELNKAKLVVTGAGSINSSWTKVGDLASARQGHSAIFTEGSFLIVGGFVDFSNTSFDTEKCTYDDGQLSCTKQAPTLDLYGFWPELIEVPGNYCQSPPVY